jgi:phosphinothricin acetyltransferase
MITLRTLVPADWDRVREIFERGIGSGNATFETTVPEWEEWDAAHLAECRFVAELDGKIAGWVALSPVSDRCVYGGVAEGSLYVDPRYQRRGVGSALLRHLIGQSEKAGYWTLQAGLFAENEASLRLLQKHGFRRVGVRQRLGKLHGTWRDVLLLERRSEVVGRD